MTLSQRTNIRNLDLCNKSSNTFNKLKEKETLMKSNLHMFDACVRV